MLKTIIFLVMITTHLLFNNLSAGEYFRFVKNNEALTNNVVSQKEVALMFTAMCIANSETIINKKGGTKSISSHPQAHDINKMLFLGDGQAANDLLYRTLFRYYGMNTEVSVKSYLDDCQMFLFNTIVLSQYDGGGVNTNNSYGLESANIVTSAYMRLR